MPPTSDIQQVLAKTQAVERLYQAHKQQPDTDQQKFAATIQQKTLEKAQQPQATSDAEQKKITKDRQDKLTLTNQKKKEQKAKRPKENTDHNEDEQSFQDDLGQIVDLKI
jgi:hypothetical protein